MTARQLAEMIVAIIKGGLVLGRAYNDTRMTARQSEQFRNYLKLLFVPPRSGSRSKEAGAQSETSPGRREGVRVSRKAGLRLLSQGLSSPTPSCSIT